MIWADRVAAVLAMLAFAFIVFLHPVSYPAPPPGQADLVIFKIAGFFVLLPWFLMRALHFMLTGRILPKSWDRQRPVAYTPIRTPYTPPPPPPPPGFVRSIFGAIWRRRILATVVFVVAVNVVLGLLEAAGYSLRG